MKNLLKNNINFFSNLPSNLVMEFDKEKINDIRSIFALNDFLDKKIKKLGDKLKIILEKIPFLKDDKSKIFIIKQNTEISENDDLDTIIKLFYSIIKVGQERKYFLLDLDKDIWIAYVNIFFQTKNLDIIYKIKDCLIQIYYPNFNQTNNSKEISYINDTLYNLAFVMIKDGLLKNEEVLTFIANYINYNQSFTAARCTFLSNGIFIKEVTEEFYKKFLSLIWRKFFKIIILNL